MREMDEREMRERCGRVRVRVRMRVRVSECGRKIRNANRMPKSDDRTESNLRRGRREGRWEEDSFSHLVCTSTRTNGRLRCDLLSVVFHFKDLKLEVMRLRLTNGATLPGEESFICGYLPGSSCERRERRETETRDTERRERERERKER